MRAFCYATGLIEFGPRLPDGALPIARGPAKPLRDFIEAKAHHGYDVEIVDGHHRPVSGSGCLLVPGVPEADCELARVDALINFRMTINHRAPAGVIVLSGRVRELLA